MGLYNKANIYLEQEQAQKMRSQAMTKNVTAPKTGNYVVAQKPTAARLTNPKALTGFYIVQETPKVKERTTHKLSKLMKVFAATALLALAPQQLRSNHQDPQMQRVPVAGLEAAPVVDGIRLNKKIVEFQEQLKPAVSFEERIALAKLVYGEAGLGTDPFEVIHTVLNRKASPLFKGSMMDIITGKNQYVGYSDKHPVTPEFLRMVNFVVNEWEANGCKAIDGCDRYYFVTDVKGHCNKFEISHDHQGRWVPHAKKQYAPRHHYCKVATDQAARFRALHQRTDKRMSVLDNQRSM